VAPSWPDVVSGRAMRAAGVHVALVDGALAAVLARGESEILPVLPEGEPARTRLARGLAAALLRWALRTGRTSLGWGGAAASDEHAAVAKALREAGFVPWGPGFRLSKVPPPPVPGMAPPLLEASVEGDGGAPLEADGTDEA